MSNINSYLNANTFTHISLKNSDKSPMTFKRNGKNKTWKTRPNEFRIPVKRGLNEYGYITQDNYSEYVCK